MLLNLRFIRHLGLLAHATDHGPGSDFPLLRGSAVGGTLLAPCTLVALAVIQVPVPKLVVVIDLGLGQATHRPVNFCVLLGQQMLSYLLLILRS